jgi:AhpD family alkylhydroperoxidase
MVGRRELMAAFISKANRCEYCTKTHGAVAALAYEAGVLAMAEDVWAWCEKSGFRGRTVTVKIKWADFQQSTRDRSMEFPIDSQGQLNEVALTLIRSVFPPTKGIRLVGVTLSNFRSPEVNPEEQLPLKIIPHRIAERPSAPT